MRVLRSFRKFLGGIVVKANCVKSNPRSPYSIVPIFLILFGFEISLFTGRFLIMPAQAQAPLINLDITQPLQLVGAAESNIEPLRAAEQGPKLTQTLFQKAEWTFYPDGRFVFLPAQPNVSREQHLFIIGTYTKIGDRLDLQGEQLGDSGSISIDGTVNREKSDLVLNVTFTISSVNTQQISRVSQRLLPQGQSASNSVNPNQLITTTKLPLKTPQQAQTLNDPRIRRVEGIALDLYDISLEGTTEAQSFGPISAQLAIEGDTGNVLVQISPLGDIVNGWGFWGSGEEVKPQTMTTQVKNGQIQVTFKSQ
jgi:hypothetical protein